MAIFNTEHYLSEAIESILNTKCDKFELLLVNDGSTDSSGNICVEFLSNDGRVKYIEQENGGLCAARNTGLKNAIGDYVWFVDSDNIINNEIDKLVLFLEKLDNKYDIIYSNYSRFVGNTVFWESNHDYDNERLEKFNYIEAAAYLWGDI